MGAEEPADRAPVIILHNKEFAVDWATVWPISSLSLSLPKRLPCGMTTQWPLLSTTNPITDSKAVSEQGEGAKEGLVG
jgi:hypothetical protein